MSDRIGRFDLPPQRHRRDGSLRRVGFELEFSGITLDQTVAALQSALGGEIELKSAVERGLHVESLGRFGVELDWTYLKRKAVDLQAKGEGGEWLDLLSRAAALLIPVEVVCPPIPLDRLGLLDPMVRALRESGAIGTDESFIAAYGVHVNVEIPRLDAVTLDAYLKAFALLQWWLVDAGGIDATRRLSPYIDLYPEAYLRRVLSRTLPDLDGIATDYLEYNPSRNRALDLLPLLAEIDEQRVRRLVPDPKVRPRPAFHYRLPDCHIEHPAWSLAVSWNAWCVVERLAACREDLDRLAGAFLAADRPVLGVNRSAWVARIGRWLVERGWA